MKTDRVYIATVSIVVNQKLNYDKYFDTITTLGTKPFDTRLLYKKENSYYDLVTNEQYKVGCDYCMVGDLFINLDYPIYRLTEYINKASISKRKLIKIYKLNREKR